MTCAVMIMYQPCNHGMLAGGNRWWICRWYGLVFCLCDSHCGNTDHSNKNEWGDGPSMYSLVFIRSVLEKRKLTWILQTLGTFLAGPLPPHGVCMIVGRYSMATSSPSSLDPRPVASATGGSNNDDDDDFSFIIVIIITQRVLEGVCSNSMVRKENIDLRTWISVRHELPSSLYAVFWIFFNVTARGFGFVTPPPKSQFTGRTIFCVQVGKKSWEQKCHVHRTKDFYFVAVGIGEFVV